MAQKLAYLPIDPNDLPVRFSVKLSRRNRLVFEIAYNSVGDFYTAHIFAPNGDAIAYGRKFMFGQNLLEGLYHENVPEGAVVVPLDWTGEDIDVNIDTFMKSIRAYVKVVD